MLNRSTHARAILVAFAIAAFGCNSKKENTATATSGPSAQQSAAPASSAAPIGSAPVPDASASAQKDAGPPEWYACTKPQDCAVVSLNCCPFCDPINFEGLYTSVNAKFKDQFAAHQGCAAAKCRECPPEQPDYPRTSANFFSLCEAGRCVAVDLRFSKYVACKTAKDCVFRFGLGCCEGCGDHDLVTYNPASSLDRDVCPQKPKCPPVSAECRANRHPQHSPPECAGERCQLSD